MAAEVHSIAAIVHRLGDPAYLNVPFEYHGNNIRAAQQFQGSSQPGRPRACHDCDFIHADGVAECASRQS